MFTTSKIPVAFLAALSLAPRAALAHLCPWTPSMYGFNVTAQTFPYDNRPMTPLMNLPFNEVSTSGPRTYASFRLTSRHSGGSTTSSPTRLTTGMVRS